VPARSELRHGLKARVSIGKTSLTVRYAELAAAEAKKSTAHQHAVIVVAFSEPAWNR
jgi:hypothetical protein